jgi:Ca2+-binding EF-hand superfamily protein
MSTAELNLITKVFKDLDKDGDGILNANDILLSIKEYCPELAGQFETERADAFSMINIGVTERPPRPEIGSYYKNDEFLSYSRFCMAAMNQSVLINKDKIKSAFNLFDADESGTVTQEELKYILDFLNIMTDEEIEEFIKRYDSDANNTINRKEFRSILEAFEVERSES